MKNIWVVITILIGIQVGYIKTIQADTFDSYQCIGKMEFINSEDNNYIETLEIHKTEMTKTDGYAVKEKFYIGFGPNTCTKTLYSDGSNDNRHKWVKIKETDNQIVVSCDGRREPDDTTFFRFDKLTNDFLMVSKVLGYSDGVEHFFVSKFTGKCY